MGIIFLALLIYTVFLCLIATGLIVLSAVSRVKDEPVPEYNPYTLVIVPCRGKDYSLRQNLMSIKSQSYSNFKLLGVVDSSDDPAVEDLGSTGTDYMISYFACSTCSGKVRAITSAIKSHPGFQVYVIADSDITVGKDWLRDLVGPLKDDSVGLSTTFPYFRPVGGFWSHFKSGWGAVGKALMRSRATRFGWGGSLAFRASLLDDRSLEFFSLSVSDDTALTEICKTKGLEIQYSERAEPVVNSPESLSQFLEWSDRQTALSISASPEVFTYGLLYYSLEILLLISALIFSVIITPLFLLLVVPEVVKTVNLSREIPESARYAPIIEIILPFFYIANLFRASRMDKITWRGRSYALQRNRRMSESSRRENNNNAANHAIESSLENDGASNGWGVK